MQSNLRLATVAIGFLAFVKVYSGSLKPYMNDINYNLVIIIKERIFVSSTVVV